MKNSILFVLLITTLTSYAQVVKNVGDFDKVTAFDKITVKLIPSNEYKVELLGKFDDQAEVINNNGELKIRLPFGKLLNGEDLNATVYFKKLEAIESNEGSYVSCDTEIKALDFSIIAKEGAKINVIIKADKISVSSANGAVVTLAGATKNLDVVTNSGGKFEGQECSSNQVAVSVNAGGYAKVHGTDLVDAKTRAGGEIMIYGKPKKINQKTVFGGKIEEIK